MSQSRDTARSVSPRSTGEGSSTSRSNSRSSGGYSSPTHSGGNSESAKARQFLNLVEDTYSQVNAQIYKLETKYLESTQNYGNMVRGWDGYVDSKLRRESRKDRRVKTEDRFFSDSATDSSSSKTSRRYSPRTVEVAETL